MGSEPGLEGIVVDHSLIDHRGFAWLPIGTSSSQLLCVAHSASDDRFDELWSLAHNLMEHALWPATIGPSWHYEGEDPVLHTAFRSNPHLVPQNTLSRWFVVIAFGEHRALGFGSNVEKQLRAAKLALALVVACSGRATFNGPRYFLEVLAEVKRQQASSNASHSSRIGGDGSHTVLLSGSGSLEHSVGVGSARPTFRVGGALPKMLAAAISSALVDQQRPTSVPPRVQTEVASAVGCDSAVLRSSSLHTPAAKAMPAKASLHTPAATAMPAKAHPLRNLQVPRPQRGRSPAAPSDGGRDRSDKAAAAERSRTPLKNRQPVERVAAAAEPRRAPSLRGSVAAAAEHSSRPRSFVWAPNMFEIVSSLAVNPTLPYGDGTDGGPFLALGDLVCAERFILMHGQICNRTLQRAPVNMPELFEFPHLTLARLDFGYTLRRANSTVWVPEGPASVGELDVSAVLRCMNEDLRKNSAMFRLHEVHLEHNWQGHRYDTTGGEGRHLFRNIQSQLRDHLAPLGECVVYWAEEPAHPHITFEYPQDAGQTWDEDEGNEAVAVEPEGSSSASGPSASSSARCLADELVARRLGHLCPIFARERITATVLPGLTDDHLQAVGVKAMGDRLKILAVARELSSVRGPSSALGATTL